MSLDAARTSVFFARQPGQQILMKMGTDRLRAVEVVARTGEVEAVRVFDLGPRNETMSRGPGEGIAGRTCEGD